MKKGHKKIPCPFMDEHGNPCNGYIWKAFCQECWFVWLWDGSKWELVDGSGDGPFELSCSEDLEPSRPDHAADQQMIVSNLEPPIDPFSTGTYRVHPGGDGSLSGPSGARDDSSPRSPRRSFKNLVRQIRGFRLGHDAGLDKQAVPLWPDVGKALGLSKNLTYKAAKSGEIPTIQFGRRLRVPLTALDKLLKDAGTPKAGKK